MDQSTLSRKAQLNFASQFSNPVHAVYQGETVRISHVGDEEGMSPVYLVIDSQGKSAWVPQRDVTIIDQNFLPLGQESLDALTNIPSGGGSRRLGQQGSTNQASRSGSTS